MSRAAMRTQHAIDALPSTDSPVSQTGARSLARLGSLVLNIADPGPLDCFAAAWFVPALPSRS